MGKETPRREANRLGRVPKKKKTALGVKPQIVKARAPREIRDAAGPTKADESDAMMDVGAQRAANSGKSKKPGKVRRKKQRHATSNKRAARANKEKRKHIN